MSTAPHFPAFKPIELEDRAIIHPLIKAYRPETSEWTFTNLFIWGEHYGFQWSLWDDRLIVIATTNGGKPYAMQPLGSPGRADLTVKLLEWMKDEQSIPEPSIERADRRLVAEFEGDARVRVEPTRDHFDYVYLREDLSKLGGNRYRTKRNHINKISRTYTFEYVPLESHHIEACYELQSRWCEARRCEEDLSLQGEWDAIREILANYPSLDLTGGVVTIEGKVQAFTVGELLNETTAVIHVEKANPEVAELYTVVNQQCAEKCWGDITYINREQDLGLPGPPGGQALLSSGSSGREVPHHAGRIVTAREEPVLIGPSPPAIPSHP